MPDAPNILFLFPDQLRPDWLGCVGRVPVRTPHLDALAARGVRFARAYCTAPLCAPSRASLAGGRLPHRIGVPTNQEDYPLDQPTFYRLLRDAGYRVGAVGKTDLHKPTHVNGPDGWTPRMGRLGFTGTVDSAGKWDAVNHCRPVPHDPYTGYLHERGLLETHCADYERRRQAGPGRSTWASPLPREHHTDEFVGRAAEAMLRAFPRQAPWLLQVNFPSPHDPFDPPAELLDRWRQVAFPPPVEPAANLTADEHQAARRAYAALVEGIDERCGRLIEVVAERGETDRTLVLFSSDHGELLGDHGRWGKSWFTEPSMGVPLLAAGAGVAGGRVSQALVELPDLGATCLEWAGLTTPPDWEARSLGALLRGETDEHRDVAVSLLPGHRAVVERRFKLIVRDGQMPVLFDLEEDPFETLNAIDEHPEMLTLLAERLGEEAGRPS